MTSLNLPVSFIVFFRDVYQDLLETVEDIIATCRDLHLDDFEIILVDDGSSTDNQVLDRDYPGVKFKQIRHHTSKGISAAILTGVSLAENEWVLPIPGHAMYGKEALRNVLELIGHGDIILGNRTNLAKTRPILKKLASRILRDLYRHFFFYFVGDIHGVFLARRQHFVKYLTADSGHGNAIQVISNVIADGGKLIQTETPVKEGHRKRKSRKFSDLFPSYRAISSALRSLVLTYRSVRKKRAQTKLT